MDKDVTIILGEQEQGHVILTKQRLSFWGLGCNVIRFDDGNGIIDFLTILRDADFLFDRQYVVVASLSMPRMDGLEVLKAMKQDHDFKNIPVIMLTDGRGGVNIADCLDAGCDTILSLPLKKDAFMHAMVDIGVIQMSPSVS